MKALIRLAILALIIAGGIFSSNWAPRDLNSMTGRVVGHWADPAKTTHLYFGPLSAGVGTFVKQSPKGVEEGTWVLRGEDVSKGTLEMKITIPRGKEDRALEIGPGGQSMKFAGQVLILKLDERQFSYVDAATSHQVWTLKEVQTRLSLFR